MIGENIVPCKAAERRLAVMKCKIEINKDGFKLGGENFNLISGDIHYFRIYPTEWRRHLLLAKEFGLNTIQTYVPWNLHEPKKGEFVFSGILDLCAYLELAAEMGFKVLLRPAPYICSECNFGGLPAWLLHEKLDIRCSDERYLKHVREYYEVLIKKILPYLSTNGGPIIMVAIENEYGSSSYDKEYLKAIKKMFEDLGVDVPLYTTDNWDGAMIMGSLDGVMRGANFRSIPGLENEFYEFGKKMYPEFPFFVGELWAGRAMYWGEPYKKRDPLETALSYRDCLKRGYVDLYMFSGGTNFGFFSGSIIGKSLTPRPGTPDRYIAHTTSYDENALVSENGLPTEKYYLCRDVLLESMGKPKNPDRTLPFDYHVQTPEIHFSEGARLFDNLDVLTDKETESVALMSFEELGADNGFVLYETDIEGYRDCGEKAVSAGGVSDRATFYDNEKYIGKLDRDRAAEEMTVDATDRTVKLSVLCECVSRINCGYNIDNDRKGIHYITFDKSKLYHYRMRNLPMTDVSGVSYKPLNDFKDNDPMFFRGYFDAEAGVDTFLDMRGWGALCLSTALI